MTKPVTLKCTLARSGQMYFGMKAHAGTDAASPLGHKVRGTSGNVHELKAGVRAKVEHPYRVVKSQFGYVKVRYRGLKKNAWQFFTLFALSNLWMARDKMGLVHDCDWEPGKYSQQGEIGPTSLLKGMWLKAIDLEILPLEK